ncbi:MAG: hypothetical protein Q7S38_00650 [bacterium]|nr:hypothetical protein [bacterium]
MENQESFSTLIRIKESFLSFLRSPLLRIGVILIILAAVPLTVFIAQKQQEIRQRASGEETSLYFIQGIDCNAPLQTDQILFNIGQQYTYSLCLDSGGNAISGFDITASFGNASSLVTISSISEGQDAGRFNSEVEKTIDTQAGTARFIKANTDAAVITGKLQLAQVTFTPNAQGSGAVAIQGATITSPTTDNPLTVSKPTFSYAITSTGASPISAVNQLSSAVLDINRDGCVGIGDFYAWRDAYQEHACSNTYPDVNNDSAINLLDYNKWFIYREIACTASPAAQCPYSQNLQN